jgi:hypothetical protein
MQLIAAELGISEAFVEKDWHVVQIIATLSQLKHGGFKPVFSGGTSLSKAYGLIERWKTSCARVDSYQCTPHFGPMGHSHQASTSQLSGRHSESKI